MAVKYVSVAEMIAIEKAADANGLTYDQMMANAGKSLAEAVDDAYSHLENKNVFGLAGKGNNGGDTLVALGQLIAFGWETHCYLVGERGDDPLLQTYLGQGGSVTILPDDPGYHKLVSLVKEAGVILDGVLGTGIRLPLKSPVADFLSQVEEALSVAAQPPYLVAVDCPSGIDCDSGEVADQSIAADLTVCMAAVKRGLLAFPAYDYLGKLEIGVIGQLDHLQPWQAIRRFVIDQEFAYRQIPIRPNDSHKGTFGTALIVAGSEKFSGAALLAGQAAFRGGAGWVTMAVPSFLHPALTGHFPEATWLPLPHQSGGISPEAAKVINTYLSKETALLLGPGFGMGSSIGKFLKSLLDSAGKLPPVVVDADGLKLLAKNKGWPTLLPPGSILTPHPGEMAILSGLTAEEIQQDRLGTAETYAKKWGHVVVLKGAFTVVAQPDGAAGILPLASAALARAGTGDVLAGLITGLLAQGMESFEAAAAGVWLHGQAGLRAAENAGSSAGVLAGDLLAELPALMPW